MYPRVSFFKLQIITANVHNTSNVKLIINIARFLFHKYCYL